MPPKPKLTKREIVTAALKRVTEKGITALTAQEFGTRPGSSARPVFTVFRSMEEVQQEVERAAMKRFEGFVTKAPEIGPRFNGLAYK